LAYEKLIAPGQFPLYYLYLNISPANIDVNIHPSKTEVNFEDAKAIFQIIRVAIKEALGKNNFVPSIDFDTDDSIDIPFTHRDKIIVPPRIEINPNYNPFDSGFNKRNSFYNNENQNTNDNLNNWEALYNGFQDEEQPETDAKSSTLFSKISENNSIGENKERAAIQLKNTYILTPAKSGIMLIHQRRAHERILFEQYHKCQQQQPNIQQLLYPATIQFTPEDFEIAKELLPELNKAGFDIHEIGHNNIVVYGQPADLQNANIENLINEIVNIYKESDGNIELDTNNRIAMAYAKATSIKNQKLSLLEINELIDNLFGCSTHNYTADGKRIISIIETQDIIQRFT